MKLGWKVAHRQRPLSIYFKKNTKLLILFKIQFSHRNTDTLKFCSYIVLVMYSKYANGFFSQKGVVKSFEMVREWITSVTGSSLAGCTIVMKSAEYSNKCSSTAANGLPFWLFTAVFVTFPLTTFSLNS